MSCCVPCCLNLYWSTHPLQPGTVLCAGLPMLLAKCSHAANTGWGTRQFKSPCCLCVVLCLQLSQTQQLVVRCCWIAARLA